MIELEFIGAAQTVTGSKHLLRTSQASVLLDCGLFQGHRRESFEKNLHLPPACTQVDAVVLSHAHIDHSGSLPSLFRTGYRGPIYATPATADLCGHMLLDAAWLMKSDALHIQKLIAKGVRKLDPVEPLYEEKDVAGVMGQFTRLTYHKRQLIAPGIHLTFLDAGHVLGSAICVLDVEDEGQTMRLAFTGDLGRRHLPILRNPEIPTGVDCLMMESTYGDRLHGPIETVTDELADVINRTHQRHGKVVIPSFALERAQEIIFALKQLYDQKRIPKMSVYVDSPLTVKLTDVFKRHPECYGPETLAMLQSGVSLFEFPGLQYITDVQDSKRVAASDAPCIIISASGMCEGGRILHHLETTVEEAKNTVLIVGYQAENTLGRRFVERRAEVKIFGELHRCEAEVCVLDGFSAHADQQGLLEFARAVRAQGTLKRVVLVHGELGPQQALANLLTREKFPIPVIPGGGDRVLL